MNMGEVVYNHFLTCQIDLGEVGESECWPIVYRYMIINIHMQGMICIIQSLYNHDHCTTYACDDSVYVLKKWCIHAGPICIHAVGQFGGRKLNFFNSETLTLYIYQLMYYNLRLLIGLYSKGTVAGLRVVKI